MRVDLDLGNKQRSSSLEQANATIVKSAEKLQSVCKHFNGMIQSGLREYSNVKQTGKKTMLFVRTRHQMKVTLVCFSGTARI